MQVVLMGMRHMHIAHIVSAVLRWLLLEWRAVLGCVPSRHLLQLADLLMRAMLIRQLHRMHSILVLLMPIELLPVQWHMRIRLPRWHFQTRLQLRHAVFKMPIVVHRVLVAVPVHQLPNWANFEGRPMY